MIFPTALRMVNTYGGQVIWLTLVRHKIVFIKSHDVLPSPKHFNNMFQNLRKQNQAAGIPQNGIQKQASSTPRHKICVFCEGMLLWYVYRQGAVWADMSAYMEADTVLFFIYSLLRKSGVSDAVMIDDEDTDVVVLASYVAHQIERPLGLKRKINIFDWSALLQKDISRCHHSISHPHRSWCSFKFLWSW